MVSEYVKPKDKTIQDYVADARTKLNHLQISLPDQQYVCTLELPLIQILEQIRQEIKQNSSELKGTQTTIMAQISDNLKVSQEFAQWCTPIETITRMEREQSELINQIKLQCEQIQSRVTSCKQIVTEMEVGDSA